MRVLSQWLVTALIVLAIPHLVSGIEVDSLGTALALALVLGLLNVLLKPLLIFITLPFTVLSFGFFLLVINAFVFWMSAQWVSGVKVEGFGPAFWASLILSLGSSLLSFKVKKEEGKVRWFFEKRTPPKTSDQALDLEKDPEGKWRQL
ncbi:MAG: phage holin family protein [Proteobacteria bacterium]|nr:phage holin family protein [Pseudomonadota bacterium]NDG27579.1 phage holin family protein [Pseudomonadota bacterium]